MDALLIVDYQNDFCAGGALEVAGADLIAPVLNLLAERFDLVIATRDWHPADHGSFRGVDVDLAAWRGIDPPSIWPVHCVQGTRGAELHPELRRDLVDIVVDKAQDTHTQGYSAFHESGLATLLRGRGVDHVVIAGLATDYCVKHSALDALEEGFAVTVVTDATRGVEVHPGDSARALETIHAAGASLRTSEEVFAAHP